MLIFEDRKFIEAVFESEAELEQVVVENYEYLFGPSSIYFPKMLIKTGGGAGTIPDGFAIDLETRKWYIVEAELAKHGVWNHIAPQVSKQLTASTNAFSKSLIADAMFANIRNDSAKLDKFADEEIAPIDIRGVLTQIINADPIIGIPIDFVDGDLSEWSKTLKVRVQLWTVEKFVEFGHPEVVIYKFPEEHTPTLDTRVDDADELPGERSRLDIKIADLIEKGLLKDGDKLTMTYKPRGGVQGTFEGLVLATGEIEVLGKRFSSPSYAAVYAIQSAGSDRKTENGWVRWKTASGELLDDVRRRYVP